MNKQFDVVIYHGGCPDGIGAAWAAWKALGDEATYLAMTHEEPLPRELIAGKRVALFDFCFKRPVLLDAIEICSEVVVVDHHISAMKDCGDIPNCHFDMDHSGAALAWKFFFPDAPTPLILRYIEDRDLWRWNLKDTKLYLASFDSYPLTIETVQKFATSTPHDVIARGGDIMRYKAQVVDRLFETCCIGSFKDTSIYPGTLGICNVNCKDFTSDVCHKLLTDMGQDVAVCWYFDHWAGVRDGHKGLLRVSLRATEESGIDVSEIAKKFGGGGHKLAAGFEVKGNLDDVFSYPLIAVA